MPTRYREKLRERSGGRLVITIARHEPCLHVYAERDWQTVEETLIELDGDETESRRQQHMLIGFAADVELDGNGRVVIPPRLRDYAQLREERSSWWVSRCGWNSGTTRLGKRMSTHGAKMPSRASVAGNRRERNRNEGLT